MRLLRSLAERSALKDVWVHTRVADECEDLGWVNTEGGWDTEIHYTDLYNLTDCSMFSEIKSPLVIRLYNDKCKVNLLTEYPNIVRYSRVTKIM